MRCLISLLIGYLLGSLNPAALLGKTRHTDLRHTGTGNLGATNTIIVMGKKLGLLVMALDILKSFLAAKIASWLFGDLEIAGYLAALGAVIGHIFSCFHHFHGGKGVAAFVGMILYYKPSFFLILAGLAILLMLITNLGVVGPTSAAVLFPIFVYCDSRNLPVTMVCSCVTVLILYSHLINIRKIKSGEEMPVKSFLRKVFPGRRR